MDIPPIGVMPDCIWNNIRFLELLRAMLRYTESGKEVPKEWVDEFLWLGLKVYEPEDYQIN